MPIPGLTIIGERINPGFRSTQALFDDEDFAGIQALAVRQAQAGASYLNVNAGTKALKDPHFMVEVVRAIQAVVDLPLSLDCPDFAVLKTVLEAYDAAKAKGMKPVINSISESRWELAELMKVRPCRAILMSSEQERDGRIVLMHIVGTQRKDEETLLADALKMANILTSDDMALPEGRPLELDLPDLGDVMGKYHTDSL